MRKTTTHSHYSIQQEFHDYLGYSLGRFETLAGAKSALRSIRKRLSKRNPDWRRYEDTSIFSLDFSERKEIAERLRVIKTETIIRVLR